jgi:hypothetical protein
MNIQLRWIGAAAALAAAVCVCAGSAAASARASGQVAFHPNIARASTRTGVVHLSTFQSPSHNIVCEIGDEDKAHCETFKPPQGVSLDFRGKVVTCTGRRICGPCPPGATGCSSFARMPVLAYGRRDDYSLYSCVSRTTGVTCTVIRGAAKGKGFRIAKAGITRVRSTPSPPPSPTSAEFNSVPGWFCLMFSSGVSCEDVYRGWEADLSPSGAVSICTAGTDACHTAANPPQGIPTITVGQQVTVQPFRCTYATKGLTCAVIKTGVGFLITPTGATRVG